MSEKEHVLSFKASVINVDGFWSQREFSLRICPENYDNIG